MKTQKQNIRNNQKRERNTKRRNQKRLNLKMAMAFQKSKFGKKVIAERAKREYDKLNKELNGVKVEELGRNEE